MKITSTLIAKGDRKYVQVIVPGLPTLRFDVTGLNLNVRQRKRVDYLKMFRRMVIGGGHEQN